MPHSSVRYERVLNPQSDGDDDDSDEDPGDTELEHLAPNGPAERSPARSLFAGLLTPHLPSSGRASPVLPPTTPRSSDGVFTNIPAKPSSSKDRNKDDDELGPDEWIFMTPDQRKKLAPPKYSRIKRDRAPRYTTEYTPPPLPMNTGPRKSKRAVDLKPRINSLPAGSSAIFLSTVFLSTLLPFLGFFLVYATTRCRWTSHATRLGCHTGLGLGLVHVGAMIVYIPALCPALFGASSVPLVLFLLWTVFVGLPFGWLLSMEGVREFIWVKTEERVLRANLGVAAAPANKPDEDDEDVESGYRYIEGTDIRVRDLRKILARARDARLARSLRAAGF